MGICLAGGLLVVEGSLRGPSNWKKEEETKDGLDVYKYVVNYYLLKSRLEDYYTYNILFPICNINKK